MLKVQRKLYVSVLNCKENLFLFWLNTEQHCLTVCLEYYRVISIACGCHCSSHLRQEVLF